MKDAGSDVVELMEALLALSAPTREDLMVRNMATIQLLCVAFFVGLNEPPAKPGAT